MNLTLRKAVEKLKSKEGDQSSENVIYDMNEVHLEYGILQKRKSKEVLFTFIYLEMGCIEKQDDE